VVVCLAAIKRLLVARMADRPPRARSKTPLTTERAANYALMTQRCRSLSVLNEE
jgi:hypothetical protein